MISLAATFSGLGPSAKANFLARVAHLATVAARESYAPDKANPTRDYNHPDPLILRDANNFVHRVTGYIVHVLERTELVGQDESVMAMIEEYFRQRGLWDSLPKWLESSI